MATTTAVSSFRSAGIPDDAVGAVGDTCFDTSNRITWVKQAGNTWVGGGYSNIGPVGPAQLSYNGVPPNTFGQNGSGATDQTTGLTYLKNSSGWVQVGSIIGPQGGVGPQGYSSLTTQAMTPSTLLLANGTTASSTAQPFTIPGTSITQYFTPVGTSALMGFNAGNSGAALSVSLIDVAANATVYQGSLAGNAQANAGVFTVTQYPLTAGKSYAWNYTGSGTANCVFNPYYLTPSAATSACIGVFGQFMSPANTAFSGTAFNAVAPGVTSTGSVNTRTFQLLRAGALVGFAPTYYPSTAGAASASVSWSIKNYTANTTLASGTVTNTGLPQAASYLASPISIAANQTIYVQLSGSGTGTFSADMSVII